MAASLLGPLGALVLALRGDRHAARTAGLVEGLVTLGRPVLVVRWTVDERAEAETGRPSERDRCVR